MSVRKLRLTIRPNARADIESVFLYTRMHWGTEQRGRYRAKPNVVLDSLTRHPELGVLRNDILTGIRTFQVERHLIYSTVTETQLVVSRVLHVNQDTSGKIEM